LSSSRGGRGGGIRVKDCLITYIIFDIFEALATSGHSIFRGVASYYLANRTLGDYI
jgi:hypothetical protein